MEKEDLKITINTVVHCPTEELANKVLAIADNLGYKWHSGNRYIKDNHWIIYGKNTCYELSWGYYAYLNYYESQKKTIISAEEFINLHNMEQRTVKLDLNTAREWYKKGGELQTVALQAYTKKELATDVKERIKTFEDALEELRANGDNLVLQYYDYIDNIHVADDNLLTYIKLRIISKALNERDVILGEDILYYPYIRFISMKEYNSLSDKEKERGVLFGGLAPYGSYAGFVCSSSYSAPTDAIAAIGSRLCLLSSDLALYCLKQFPYLWLTYLTE